MVSSKGMLVKSEVISKREQFITKRKDSNSSTKEKLSQTEYDLLEKGRGRKTRNLATVNK